jgi:FixJ family two-component response regulator
MICVVDDDPMVRDATVDLVDSFGYTAIGFDSGEAFLESNRVESTSCLITDQNLPGLSGTDLQARLRADGCRMPVIFITGFPESSVCASAFAAGALAFLTKPYEDAALLKFIQLALQS